MIKLAKLSIATTVIYFSLFIIIDRARSATFLSGEDRRSLVFDRILFGEYSNLNFLDNSSSISVKEKLDFPKTASKSSQTTKSIILAEDPQAKIKSQQIINNSLAEKIDRQINPKLDSIAPSSPISHDNSHNSTSIVLYDKTNPIVQSQKALDNLLDAKVDRSLSAITTISDPINNPPQSELAIVANNLILSEKSDSFDSLSTPPVFLLSIIIYGGIIITVVVQIALKTGADFNTILYWLRHLTQPQLKPRKDRTSASKTNENKPNRYTQNLAVRQKVVDRELAEFIKIAKSLEARANEYNYLKDAIDIITTALDNKQSLAILDRYETTYRSSKQQQFYSFVMETIADIIDRKQLNFNSFQSRVEQKLQEVLSQTKTDVGRQALKEYTKDLYQVASTPLGLKLVYLLKQSQSGNYSILDTIFDIASEASKINLLDINLLKELVTERWESLEKFGKVINLSLSQNVPATHVKIVQYVGLYYKFKTK